MKNLVIFYSLEGNTKLIANTISKNINADILELVPKKTYHTSGFKKFFWGGKSVLFKEKPELVPINIDINDYNNIFIGTPIWAHTYAPAFNTFLHEHNIEGKNIALFACHAGGGADKFYKNIKNTIPNNTFVGEIDFMDPLKNNTDDCVTKASQWSSDILDEILSSR